MMEIPRSAPERRTQSVYTAHRRPLGAPPMDAVSRCIGNGSGEIRTHGTLSRTHTFQTSGVAARNSTSRAESALTPRIARDAVHGIYERGCASGRTRGVHTAHRSTFNLAACEALGGGEPRCPEGSCSDCDDARYHRMQSRTYFRPPAPYPARYVIAGVLVVVSVCWFLLALVAR